MSTGITVQGGTERLNRILETAADVFLGLGVSEAPPEHTTVSRHYP
jgi:hypothetical protein